MIHYGVEGHSYLPDTQDSTETPAEGGERAINKRMFWFVRQRTPPGGSHPAYLEMMRTWDITDKNSSEEDLDRIREDPLTERLLECEGEFVDGVRVGTGLNEVFRMDCYLGNVAREMFVKRNGKDGRRQWWELKYRLTLVITDWFWDFEMLCGGTVCGVLQGVIGEGGSFDWDTWSD